MGFDASEFAWTPTTDDEREHVRRQGPRYTHFAQLEDDEAVTLVEEILALRKRWLRSENAGEKEWHRALSLANRLVLGIAGWALAEQIRLSPVDDVLIRHGADPLRDRYIDLHRNIAVAVLASPLPLLPPATRDYLLEPLQKLSYGVVESFLAPKVGGPRGIDVEQRREIELQLLGWVEWQVARKQLRRGAALDSVAKACNLATGQAVRSWRKRLEHHMGPSLVQNVLNACKAIGVAEVEGKDPSLDPALAPCFRSPQSLDVQSAGRNYQFVSRSRSAKKGRRVPKKQN